MVKSEYSKRRGCIVWGYDAVIDGVRKRQFGFTSKGAAETALGNARAAAFARKQGGIATRDDLAQLEQAVVEAIAEVIEKRIRPLEDEIQRLNREARDQLRMVEEMRATVERRHRASEGLKSVANETQLIRPWEAARLIDIPETKLLAAIRERQLPSTKVGGAWKVTRADAFKFAARVYNEGLAAAKDQRRAELRDLIEATRLHMEKVLELARLYPVKEEAQVKVREACPELADSVIKMLPDATASELAVEQVSKQKFNLSGRTLKRMLADPDKPNKNSHKSGKGQK